MRLGAILVAALCVLGASVGGGIAAGQGARGISDAPLKPATTPAPVLVEPEAGLTTSGVATERGTGWFATDIALDPDSGANTIYVYRWIGETWSLDGTVSAAGAPGGIGVLRSAQLTHSGAPDFTFSDGNGADWNAFVVAAHLDGSWRAVRFDYGSGLTTVADARGVQGHLVMGEDNGCGCAAGPETYIWYRFNGQIFAPTSPPGAAPPCTPSAVGAARPVLGGLPGADPWTPTDLAARLSVTRVTCADGWALATATRNGASVVALFEQSGKGWQEGAVGGARELNSNAEEFALPLSVLRRLEAHLGLDQVPPPKAPSSPSVTSGAPSGRGASATPAVVPITPGSQFVDSGVVTDHSADWFAAADISPNGRQSASLSLYVYRWTGHAWMSSGHVRLPHVTGPQSSYYPNLQLTGAPIGTSQAPAFFVEPAFSSHQLAVVNDVGGHWHATD